MPSPDVKKLNTLIATTIDSANGFEEAAERVRATSLASQLADLARDRWEVVANLQRQVTSLGGEPTHAGTAKAAAHRRWVDLKSSIVSSDRAVLQEVENGETYLNTKYEAAMDATELSPAARHAVSEAFDKVKRGKDSAAVLQAEYGLGLTEESEINWRAIAKGVGVAAAVGGIIYAARGRSGRSSTPTRSRSQRSASGMSQTQTSAAAPVPLSQPATGMSATTATETVGTPAEAQRGRSRKSSTGASSTPRLAASTGGSDGLGAEAGTSTGFGSEDGAAGSFNAGSTGGGFGTR